MSNKPEAANNSKLLNTIKKQTATNKNEVSIGVGQQVSKFINDDFNSVIIAILVITVIILIIYLYVRTFKKLNKQKQEEIIQSEPIELAPLPACTDLVPELQHRLCDYYIAASFNTPAIGRQALDYVSTDMVSKALLNGARYIQIPIASADVNYDTEPVVATTDGYLITSLNTLPLREVLLAIKDSAFKYIQIPDNEESAAADQTAEGTTKKPIIRKVNYPLIVHLQIRTNNDHVLDQAADMIKLIFAGLMLGPRPYYQRPITFEKLCKLLNKIILISTPGYEASRLKEIVVPVSNQFLQTINSDQIAPDLSNPDDQLEYYKSLSQTQQKSMVDAISNLGNYFKTGTRAPAKEMLDAILGPNAPISLRLPLFNMVGLTIVQPMITNTGAGGTQIESQNYNPADAFMNGCQLVAMNYQTPDETLINYIKVFSKSSYILKPAGLRLPAADSGVGDALGSYSFDNTRTGLADPSFILKYGNGISYLRLVVQSSQTESGGMARTVMQSGEKLRIAPTRPNMSANDMITTMGFVIRQSPLARTGDLIMIASATNPNLVLSVNPDFDKQSGSGEIAPDVFLAPVGRTNTDLKWQTFQPEYPPLIDQKSIPPGPDVPEYSVSFRLYPPGMQDAFYITGFRNSVKLGPKTDDNIDQITFGIIKLPIIQEIRIASSAGHGILKTFAGGVISLSSSGTIDRGSRLIIENAPPTTNKVGSKSIAVYLKDSATAKYLVSDGRQLKAVLTTPDISKSVFIITFNQDLSTLVDFRGSYLFSEPDGTLSFKQDQPMIQNAVKNSRGKEIKPARYGPALGAGKNFQIMTSFKLKQ